jgi:hypothetical protein
VHQLARDIHHVTVWDFDVGLNLHIERRVIVLEREQNTAGRTGHMPCVHTREVPLVSEA